MSDDSQSRRPRAIGRRLSTAVRTATLPPGFFGPPVFSAPVRRRRRLSPSAPSANVGDDRQALARGDGGGAAHRRSASSRTSANRAPARSYSRATRVAFARDASSRRRATSARNGRRETGGSANVRDGPRPAGRRDARFPSRRGQSRAGQIGLAPALMRRANNAPDRARGAVEPRRSSGRNSARANGATVRAEFRRAARPAASRSRMSLSQVEHSHPASAGAAENGSGRRQHAGESAQVVLLQIEEARLRGRRGGARVRHVAPEDRRAPARPFRRRRRRRRAQIGGVIDEVVSVSWPMAETSGMSLSRRRRERRSPR